MASNVTNNQAPSLLQPLSSIFPAPIIANRAPAATDKKYPIGQLWIYKASNLSYILTSVVANVATWTNPASGGAGTFTTLATTGSVTVGNALIVTTGGATISAGGAAITGTTTVVGAFTQTGGAANIGSDATTNAVNIGTGAAAKTITIGNATGATSLVLNAGTGAVSIGTNATVHTTTVGSATGASSTVIQSGTGNVFVTAPFFEVNTATPFLISSGNGAPAGAICANVGDLYIRTDGSTTSTRMYICTVVGTTWTSVTTAA